MISGVIQIHTGYFGQTTRETAMKIITTSRTVECEAEQPGIPTVDQQRSIVIPNINASPVSFCKVSVDSTQLFLLRLSK